MVSEQVKNLRTQAKLVIRHGQVAKGDALALANFINELFGIIA